MVKNFLKILIVLIIAVTAPGLKADEEKKITAVEIRGNKRVSTITILGNLKLKSGDMYASNLLQDEVKRLYELGYFSDIEVSTEDYQEGVKVIFDVKEKEVIKELIIEGNKAVGKERITEVVRLKQGTTYNKKVLMEDIASIEDLYRKKGFHAVKVTHKEEVKEKEGEVIVSIYINEGVKIKIKEIRFFGNTAFTAREIRKGSKMKTTQDKLFSAGIFSQDTFDNDLEKVLAFYREHGYVNAGIIKTEVSPDVTKRWILISIFLTEGEQYRVGDIALKGNAVFTSEELSAKVTMRKGEIFNEKKLGENKKNIQAFYAEKGYIFASVRDELETLEKDKVINVSFIIREEELAYIDEVIIRGNTKTRDKVIRREVMAKPGERFDGEKIKRTHQNLNNLGYFDQINVDIGPGTAPNRKNLIFDVEEKKTGTFTFGGGYSSVNRVVGFVEISQNNFDIGNFPTFMGGGQTLKLRGDIGSISNNISLSFTEPWLMDKPVSLGFDLYDISRQQSQFSRRDYDEERKGGDISLGWKMFDEWTKTYLTYKYEEVSISNINQAAVQAIRDEEGSFSTSSFGPSIVRSTLDNIFDPASGTRHSLSAEMAGGIFGGDRDFTRYILDSRWYHPVPLDFVFSLHFRGGLVEEFGDTVSVPIYERFFLGGSSTVRGYQERDIGPKDTTGIPVGGDVMLLGNIEFIRPLVEQVKGAVFYDAGYVWDDTSDIELGDLKSSVGIGLRVTTPIGPIRFDYGFALDREPGDKGGRFHFSMGYSF